MPQHKHIIIVEPGQERNYTATSSGRGVFSSPPRDRRVHARKLIDAVKQAETDANTQAEGSGIEIRGWGNREGAKQGYDD